MESRFRFAHHCNIHCTGSTKVAVTRRIHLVHLMNAESAVHVCSRCTNSRMTHETAPSGKWVTRHPVTVTVTVTELHSSTNCSQLFPSFTSCSSHTRTYRLAYTHPFIVLTCGFYTGPARGKLVGGPSGPLP